MPSLVVRQSQAAIYRAKFGLQTFNTPKPYRCKAIQAIHMCTAFVQDCAM